MIKAVIIEDEKPTARRLERMLTKENVFNLAILNSKKEAKKWFAQNKLPDLIFLDIHLSDGLGFDLIDHKTKDIPIIFTTAFDQYALQAFKQNSIDYLLKPVKQEELHAALEKFKQRTLLPDWKKLLQSYHNLQEKESYKERFVVKKGNYIHLIPVDEIACFLSEDKITKLINLKKQSFYLDESLDKIQTDLSPEKFFRINRKYIIAIDDIKEMFKYSNSRLKIILKTCDYPDMIVARERVKEFLRVLNK